MKRATADVIAITPVRRRKVYQDVAEALEGLIRDGKLGEGDVLPAERELMARFKVGRPAVREALLALQRNGLVVLSNGARARVSRPTTGRILEEFSSAARVMLANADGMRHFQSARRLFESAIARHAARHATPDDIARLREALERNEAAQGNPEQFERTDVAFHYEIVRIAGNPLFVGLHEALTSWLLEQRTVSLEYRGSDRHAIEFHTRVFEAIAAHDPNAAEAAMDAHLAHVADMYWKVAGRPSRKVARRAER